MQRGRQVADLARRREARPPRQIAGGDRPRHFAQLDDGPGHRAGKHEREEHGGQRTDHTGGDDGTTCSRDGLFRGCRRDGDAREA